jgi:hypothetical protein
MGTFPLTGPAARQYTRGITLLDPLGKPHVARKEPEDHHDDPDIKYIDHHAYTSYSSVY